MSDFTEHMLSDLYTRVENKLNIRMPETKKLLQIIEGLKIQTDRMCTQRRQRICLTYSEYAHTVQGIPDVVLNPEATVLGAAEKRAFLIVVPWHHREKERVWYV